MLADFPDLSENAAEKCVEQLVEKRVSSHTLQSEYSRDAIRLNALLCQNEAFFSEAAAAKQPIHMHMHVQTGLKRI